MKLTGSLTNTVLLPFERKAFHNTLSDLRQTVYFQNLLRDRLRLWTEAQTVKDYLIHIVKQYHYDLTESSAWAMVRKYEQSVRVTNPDLLTVSPSATKSHHSENLDIEKVRAQRREYRQRRKLLRIK